MANTGRILFCRPIPLDRICGAGQIDITGMHEIGIMESAMDAVLLQVREHGGQSVHRIVLRVGALSGVDPEALQFAFDVVKRDTVAEAAVLEIDSVPARARCAACKEEFSVDSGFIYECPHCGQLSGDVCGGRELELTRIELS